MVNKSKDFIKSNILTGLIALLPIVLFLAVLLWLYGIIARIIIPISNIFGTPGVITNLIVIISLIITLFIIGLIVRTAPGKWFGKTINTYILHKIPGYNTIKDIIKPLTGNGYQKSFKGVALVNIYENSVLVTAFITDKNVKKGYTTVFVPTGPNPTSGQIMHMKNKYVHPVDISVDKVLKSVISVGSGSAAIIEKMNKK